MKKLFVNKSYLMQVVEFIFFVCIYALINRYCVSDMIDHAHIAVNRCIENDLYSGNFIFYLLLNLFSGFSCHRGIVKIVMCILLAFATTWRIALSKEGLNVLSKTNSFITEFLGISMVFVFVLPIMSINNWYIGYYVPNVWHNSTTIFLFPFAVLLYQYGVRILKQNYISKCETIEMSIITMLGVFIKPSFFFCFSIAFTIFLFYKNRFNKVFWIGMIPIFIGILSVGLVYLGIYNRPSDGSFVYIDYESLLCASFWKKQIPYIIISMIFPLGAFISNFKYMTRDLEFWFNVILVLVAFSIFFVCKEGGPRASHGNFYWQIVLAVWCTFYYSLKIVLLSLKNKTHYYLNMVSIGIYMLSVLSGIVYLIRYFVTKLYF